MSQMDHLLACPRCGYEIVRIRRMKPVVQLSPEDLLKAKRAKSVEELDLSVRAYNCLKNRRIETVGELIKYSPAELMRTKNFGKRSLREISNVLAQMDLHLIGERV